MMIVLSSSGSGILNMLYMALLVPYDNISLVDNMILCRRIFGGGAA